MTLHLEREEIEGPIVVSFTIPRPFSANSMWQRRMTKKGRRDLTPAYKAWRDKMGWDVKRQTVGMLPIECRFDVLICLPPTRMDHDNAVKPILDLAQHIGLITNDRNVHGVQVAPSERDDCLVVLTLRHELAARPAVKRRPSLGGARKSRPTAAQVARAERGRWLP